MGKGEILFVIKQLQTQHFHEISHTHTHTHEQAHLL